MDNCNEVWKDVVGYEGLYQISSLGRVRSVARIVSGRKGIAGCPIRERILKLEKRRNGYLSIHLCKQGTKTRYTVHRLVCIAFIVNPENKPQVNHKNGVKDDNRLINLEWNTGSENQQHAVDVGLRKTGFSNKARIACTTKKKKLVLDLATGIYFDSLKEAAHAKNYVYSTLSGRLTGFRENRTSLVFV